MTKKRQKKIKEKKTFIQFSADDKRLYGVFRHDVLCSVHTHTQCVTNLRRMGNEKLHEWWARCVFITAISYIMPSHSTPHSLISNFLSFNLAHTNHISFHIHCGSHTESFVNLFLMILFFHRSFHFLHRYCINIQILSHFPHLQNSHNKDKSREILRVEVHNEVYLFFVMLMIANGF
jgi:hypothetical protein